MPRNPASVARTNKTRGARCETIVCQYLTQELGRPIERRHLSGSFDRGDIAGIPGVVGEIKSGQPNFSAWLRELAKEMKNDHATQGFIWWAPPGYLQKPESHVMATVDIGLARGALAPLFTNAAQMAKHVRALNDFTLGVSGYMWNGLVVTSGWIGAEWLTSRTSTVYWRAKGEALARQARDLLSDPDTPVEQATPEEILDYLHRPAAN